MEKLYSASAGWRSSREVTVLSFWELSFPAGLFFLDFAWLGGLLLAGFYIRHKVSFFRKNLIPANLLAGILGLVLGMNGLQWIDLTSERLGIYVYHLLALLFIGLGLRSARGKIGLSSVKTGIIFIIIYLVQGIAGLGIAFGLIYSFTPDLFAGIGLLPPLSFGMNPGIAFTIGQNWEAYGFEDGGIVGLTFSAAGFFAAYTTGVWMVKRGIKRGEAFSHSENKAVSADDFHVPEDQEMFSAGKITTSPGVLESLSLHAGLIGGTYLFTWGMMTLADEMLVWIGAGNEASTLWSFHFVFAAIFALGIRKVIDLGNGAEYIDDVTMTRISNLFMDLMIAASVAAISLAVVGTYWLPLLLISAAVIFLTWWMLARLIPAVFENYTLERMAAIYGNMTGTLQSGLLLLRILDERMETPVSYNLVYGSGLALVLGFPLLLLINAPVHYFDDITTGFASVLLVLLLYLALLIVGLLFINGRNE